MEGFEQERRGLFDGLQVPHSLNAIVIAAIGLLVYWLGIVGIEEAHSGIPGDEHCRLLGGMLGNVTVRLGSVGAYLAAWGGWENTITEYDLVVWVLFLGWTSAVWAFFSGAINRIAAMKLAREEGLEIKEAFKFGARKFVPNLLSIGFVLGILGFFYLICNATLAGWIGRIPVVGDILLGIFFFLVLISSFLVVFASALGILGFNLASSAIATEASDTFDGVSRAWNYILARPWTVLLTYVATFLYIIMVLFFGRYFIKVSVKSLTVGGWGLGATEQMIEVDETVSKQLELPKTMRLKTVIIPGKGEYLYGRLIHKKYRPDDAGRIPYRQGLAYALERYRAHMGEYPETLKDLIREPEFNRENWLGGPYLDHEEIGAEREWFDVQLRRRILNEVEHAAAIEDCYKRHMPTDPWGMELYYRRDANALDGYVLKSSGEDRKFDTSDDLTVRQIDELGDHHGEALNIAPLLGGTQSFLTYALFFWVKLVANLLLYGYVVAYFLSAQTTTYFLLRKDVEGDDYTEIVLSEGQEGLDYVPRAADPPPPKTDGKSLPVAEGDKPEA